MQGDFNSKKWPESIVFSLPVLHSIAGLIDYTYRLTNTDNEEDNNNDDDPFQDIDERNSFTDDNN